MSSAAPSETGLAKLLLFPDKLAALTAPAEGEPDLSFPVSVELSLTNRCNQNCLWCSDRALRERSPDALDLPLLTRLFDALAAGGTRGVTVEGGGEPTLAPFFSAAVKAARERGLAVGLIANGLDLFREGLTLDDYREFEWIRVSLDAAGPGQYLDLKGVDGYGRVLDNLARLAALRPRTTLGVGYVLTNRNDEPEALAALAGTLAALGADYLQVRPVVDRPDLTSRRALDFSLAPLAVETAALADNAAGGNLGRPCLAHSLSSVIGADGLVWLCGRLNADPAVRPLGDLRRAGFADIWRGAERRRQARQAASPEFCRAVCPPCRLTKFNRLLSDAARLKTRNFI